MRARIYEKGGVVIVEQDDYTGDRISNEYWSNGRFVMCGDTQVCERLHRLGDTLRSSPEDLLETIRREYKRGKDWEKRYNQ